MDIKVNLIEANEIKINESQLVSRLEVYENIKNINVALKTCDQIKINQDVINLGQLTIAAISYISNWISLFAKNIQGDLMPVYDYFLDNGLFQVNDEGEIQPSLGNKPDIMFELINDEITPKI